MDNYFEKSQSFNHICKDFLMTLHSIHKYFSFFAWAGAFESMVDKVLQAQGGGKTGISPVLTTDSNLLRRCEVNCSAYTNGE